MVNKIPIVCVLKCDVPKNALLPRGISDSKCSKCQKPVIIARSSRDLVMKGIGEAYCRECAAIKLADVEVLAIVETPEQGIEHQELQRARAEMN